MESSTAQRTQGSKGISLRLVLVVPFVLQIFVAVGLTGWFSLRNGQRAVNDLATQLRDKTSEQITHHLRDQLLIPHQINKINLNSIEVGLLDLENFEQLEQVFYQQMQIFDVGYMNFGNPEGGFIGVERRGDRLLINETRETSPHVLSVYKTNKQGGRSVLEDVITDLPVTMTEDWYQDAVDAGRPVWSEIYSWDDQPGMLSISSSYPIYSENGDLLGVIGVDLILSEISQFLKSLQSSPSGAVFIIERNGQLVASSDGLPLVMTSQEMQRAYAFQSPNSLISETAKYLNSRYGSLDQIQSTQHLNFS